MRVLAGHIYHESNTFCPSGTALEAFEVYRGADMLPLLPGVDVLRQAGAEVVPSVYAARWSSGTVAREAFECFEKAVLCALREALKEGLDGIFLSLHGSMTVAEIGSGEYRLLRRVREAAGRQMPIAVSMDMHANVHPGLESLVNVMTGYHTAPHTDAEETQRKAARALLRLIRSGARPSPCVCRLPMVLPGERALSADEPFRTLYDRCGALEAEEHVLAATVYVGMAWSDTPWTGVSVAVSPADEAHAPYAQACAREMARFLFDRRDSCRYAHPAYSPKEALDRALASENRPLYLSDAGDNPTAGGVGDGTILLRLAAGAHTNKRILFAPIVDERLVRALTDKPLGWTGTVAVGSGRNRDCAPVRMTVRLTDKKPVYARHGLSLEKVADCVALRCGTMDIAVADRQMAFTGMECFASVGLRPEDYDVVVLKMGYMFDEIAGPCRENIMALTPGCTPLCITAEQYRHLRRPVWPLDEAARFDEELER